MAQNSNMNQLQTQTNLTVPHMSPEMTSYAVAKFMAYGRFLPENKEMKKITLITLGRLNVTLAPCFSRYRENFNCLQF